MNRIVCLFLVLIVFSSCKSKDYKSISYNLEFCVNEIKRSYKCNDDTISKYPLNIVNQKQLMEGEICKCIKINSSNINDFNNVIVENDILRIWIYDKYCIFFEIESQNNIFREKNSFICYIVNYSRLKFLDFEPQDITQIRNNWYYLERSVSY